MDNNICAIVEYEYAAKESDELDLQKGAIIHRIKQMPGGWWQGTLKATGTTGMFPDNFVRVLDASIASNGNGNGSGGDHSDEGTGVQLRDKAATSNRRCKVIYSYTQVNDDELTLAVGDVIEFLGEVEEGWWRGRLRTKVGVFPSNFVQHIEPSPILASKRPPTIGATVTTSSLTAKASNVAASITSSSTGSSSGATAPATTTTTATSNTSKQTTKSRAVAAPPAPAESAAIGSSGLSAAGPGGPGAPMLPPKPQREYCRVEFPYAPQNDDELELKVDDIITVITTELPDKGWWKGELRGKVGVFPDNFVKMMAPSEVAPINEPATTQVQTQSQRKIGNINSTTSSHHMTTTNSSNSSTTTVTTQQKEQVGGSAASTTSKVYIKKTGSSNNSTTSSTTTTASSSAGRKESFGSRDSLNDILSETGLPTGNVAAQRKSLENKNLDLTKPPGAAISQQRSSTSSSTLTTSVGTALAASAVSKSLENMDEKVKSPPPPVLSKKPSVPLKKTPTGGVPVAGNLLGGKKKNPDGKLTSAVSHDLADGLTASKLVTGANQLPDAGAPGNLVIRRAATIAVEDTDFDRVERASILTDMRQGRVKAPKRRPPSAAINVLGESNNNSVYVNGSGTAGGAGSASELSEDGGKPAASSDDNSTGEEPQLAKPKPREWEKKKAPWMEELKASQVTRKKTSPSVEPRGATVAERTSKLFAADQAISSSISSSSSTTSKVQSSAVTSSMYAENTSSSSVTTSSSSTSAVTVTANDAIMSRSLSAAKAAASSDEETKAARPNSLAIRNQRSVSPLVKSSTASSSQSQEEKPSQLTNHQEPPANKVNQLEARIEKLEGLVQNQQRTIEELVNALKSEAERVKILRSELDKYAQCVTQV
ncbi:E3 ubiquitin-protein ligase SH3RF1 isoform X1 [Drosophila bipectinata]|uniref:E3 ubiquitin-protein ligase SH3RF1 isoform X1 n=2 Tax=Drosophila bipectinata TaxID=42026 RepID=UPI001C895C11|nr:CD2-associated protein isoform X1 [Drosophila bipectinata]XP_017101079.2 CD2-associated protein isoform X1 [Drosophila bipectinata]